MERLPAKEELRQPVETVVSHEDVFITLPRNRLSMHD
jgi:hypothetical protein